MGRSETESERGRERERGKKEKREKREKREKKESKSKSKNKKSKKSSRKRHGDESRSRRRHDDDRHEDRHRSRRRYEDEHEEDFDDKRRKREYHDRPSSRKRSRDRKRSKSRKRSHSRNSVSSSSSASSSSSSSLSSSSSPALLPSKSSRLDAMSKGAQDVDASKRSSVSPPTKRPRSQSPPTQRHEDSISASVARSTTRDEEKDSPGSLSSSKPAVAPVESTPKESVEEEKLRKRRERLQRWKEEQARKAKEKEKETETETETETEEKSRIKEVATTTTTTTATTATTTTTNGNTPQAQSPALPTFSAPSSQTFVPRPMKLKRVGISRARTRNPEDDEDEDEAGHAARRRAQKGAMAFMKRPGDASAAKGPSHAETNDDEANNMDDGEEVDPLDAYMAQLGQSASGSGSGSSLGPARDATVTPFETSNDTRTAAATSSSSVAAAAATTTTRAPTHEDEKENDDAASPAARAITLEEIMSEIKSDVDTAGDANDARDRKKGSGTARKAQREERNEQGSFHAAFLQAARARRAAEEEETRRLRAERAKEAEAASAELQKAEPVVGRGGSAGEDGVGIMGEDDGEQDAVLAELSKPSVSAIDLLKEKARKKELAPVDHSKIEYEPFTKDFYVEAPSLRAMPEGLVDLTRKELEITIRGARPLPKPIEQWAQCGLSDRIMNVLQRRGWETPFAIQRQAIPAIMSGRDLIGVAKTGSGKTLAFVVPMVRHVLDQRALEPGEGPIALIMAPARELAVQINEEVKKFARACQVNSLCCYGGVGVKDQISALKRGVEILVATPGRLIDLLTANNGRLLSLRRVTYIVLDEADRMFDMGFEPQITKVIRNTRPTRQIVMFSATFPPLVERVASEVLKERPTIIVVGGRAKPPSNIKHLVEVREPHDKFPRLLQILGEWYDEDHQILVFVKTQASCDKLFQQLVQIGYSCLTLHGGKDQIDRDNTITDFKNKVTTLMLATGVAARGLDVADLRLVINFDVPNHLEELIHRIGRTGRAGRDGTAFTFIAPDEAMYAPDLVKALRDAKQEIPPEVLALSESYKRKIVAGEAKFRSSGYRGSGFKFTEDEKTASAKQQELLRKAEEVNLGIRGDEDTSQSAVEDPAAAESARHEESVARATRLAEKFAASGAPEQAGGASSSSSSSSNASGAADSALARVRQSVAAAVERVKDASSQFTEFIIINDYPTKVRWKMTHKDTLNAITDKTGAGITVKGQYSAPGTSHTASEPPLFLLVEGGSSYDVARAATELRRILEETTRDVAALPSGTSSRYKVL